jgi:Acyltransferase
MAQTQFYPPKRHRFISWFAQKVMPWVARWRLQVNLVVPTASLARLRGLKGKPYLILCNHPTFHDPIVMFLLSARLRLPFYYLAAYEQFENQVQGWIYQRLGAYSIRRGLADRLSIAYTLEIMQERDCRLVIFPEGGCSFQNDTIMPFRSGGVQMALQAMARRVKNGRQVRDFYVVPISLKYRYTGDMNEAIAQALNQLEKALGLTRSVATQPPSDYYQRLRAIAEQLLCRYEQDYGITTNPTAPWNHRIAALKFEALQQCELRLNITPAPHEPDRERVYRIRHILSSRVNTLLPDGTDGWDVIRKASLRMLNFDAIYDGYVAAHPTPERFLDTLVRFEREVFEVDQPQPKGHRQAILHIGEPVNLKDYFSAYQRDRSATVNLLLDRLHGTMQKNLDELAQLPRVKNL